MLCPFCTKLPPLKELDRFQCPNIQEIRRSASKGCEFCRLLSAAFSDITRPQTRALGQSIDEQSNVLITTGHRNGSTFVKVGQQPTANEGFLEVTYSSSCGNMSDNTQTPNSRRLTKPHPTSHQSDSKFEFIDATFQNCKATHKGCPSNDNVVLPAFVLNVQNAQQPFLVQNDGTQRGSYICLSYCWGLADVQKSTRLTKARLPSYLNGISLSSLPQTLRDAVFVTGRLGLQYLWIDSLCIPQDDEEVRQEQLDMMGRIYTESFATIQASIPLSAGDGFLARSRNPHGPPVRMAFENDPRSGRTYFATVRHVPVERGDETPAAQRAWIFQETVLPVRLVRYSETQVVVSCRHETCNEDGCGFEMSGLGPDQYYGIRPDLRPDSIPSRYPKGRFASDQREAVWSWYQSIQTYYSMRTSSVSDDRLGALAAYAREAHRVIGGDYLAGNWSVDLLNGLRWQPWNGLLQHAARYRAPSWSWAAYDGQVCHLSSETFGDDHKGWKPTVIKAWTTNLQSTDVSPYGACTAGKIVMETRVVRFSMTGDSVNPELYFGQSTGLERDMVQLQCTRGNNTVCYAWSDTLIGIPRDKVLSGAFITPEWGLILAKSGNSDATHQAVGQSDEFIRVGYFRSIGFDLRRFQQKRITLI